MKRLAIVATPKPALDQVPLPGAIDGELVETRLSRSDTGFDVVRLDPARDLAEQIEELFDGFDAAVLVGGHTHLQMLRRYGSSVIVNPGSVGQPFSQWWPQPIRVAHWAEYGVIEMDAGRVRVDLRRVPFDVDALLRLFAASEMPHRRWWIDSWNAD